MSLPEQGGELVAVLRGANAPLLQKMIVEELSKEKSVLEHGGERKTVSYTLEPNEFFTFTLTCHCRKRKKCPEQTALECPSKIYECYCIKPNTRILLKLYSLEIVQFLLLFIFWGE